MDRDLEDRPRDKVLKARQPWWPADRLVSDMALELALTVEQLGLSASPSDWDQVWLPLWSQPLRSRITPLHVVTSPFMHSVVRQALGTLKHWEAQMQCSLCCPGKLQRNYTVECTLSGHRPADHEPGQW